VNLPGERYRFSGRWEAAGLLRALSPGLLVMVPGCVLFALAPFLPWAWLRGLAALALMLAAAAAADSGAHAGKIRNPLVVGLLGSAWGALVLWAGWVGWIARASHYRLWVWSPTAVAEQVERILAGTSTLDFPRSWAAEPASALLRWTAEALVLVPGAFFTARSLLAMDPFCESCGRWLDREEKMEPLRCTKDRHSVMEALRRGEVGPLLDMPPADGDPRTQEVEDGVTLRHQVEVKLRRCACRALNCVAVTFTRWRRKSGKWEKNIVKELGWIVLSPEAYDSLREKETRASEEPAREPIEDGE